MKEITSVKEMQKIELEILKFIVKICRENNLMYFLTDGTLIGAVRHKGFIPWDDDLDISMPRPDYNKFIKIMKRKKGRYQIKCVENSKKYNYAYAKVVDTKTGLVEEDKFQGEELGLWVDVFPIDGMGDDREKAEKIIKSNKKHVIQILLLESAKEINRKGRILELIGRKNINRFMKYKLQKNNFYKSKYVSIVAWISESMLTKREWWEKAVPCEFEGFEFNIPVGYDEILKLEYGNYMKLPPEEKRIPEHNCKVWWK